MSDYTNESMMSEATRHGHHHVETTEKRSTSVFGQRPHAEHGALIDHKIPQADAVEAEPDLLWSRVRHVMREPFSEFFGVFIFILFGDGVIAQVVLSKGTKGDYQSISWGWG
jgi:aquaglyceroporin related protein